MEEQDRMMIEEEERMMRAEEKGTPQFQSVPVTPPASGALFELVNTPSFVRSVLETPKSTRQAETAERDMQVGREPVYRLPTPPPTDDLIRPLHELAALVPPLERPLPLIKVQAWRGGAAVQLSGTEQESLKALVEDLPDIPFVRKKRERKKKETSKKTVDEKKKKDKPKKKKGRPKKEESFNSSDETSVEITSWDESIESSSEEVKKKKRQTSTASDDSSSSISSSNFECNRTTTMVTRSRASPDLLCYKTRVLMDDTDMEEDLAIPPSPSSDSPPSPPPPAAPPSPSVDMGELFSIDGPEATTTLFPPIPGVYDNLERDVLNDWLSWQEEDEEHVQDRDLEDEWLRVYAGHRRITAPVAPLPLEGTTSREKLPPNVGRSGIGHLLSVYSRKRLEHPDSAAVPFSHETQQKHRWVYRMWELYCTTFGITPLFPLQPKAVSEFIWTLGVNSLLCVSSICSAVHASLVSLHTIHTNAPISRYLQWVLKQAILRVRTAKQEPDKSHAKPPCLISDLSRILRHIPDCHPSKAHEASLFLFALCCGARASTCAEVCLSDITRVVCLKDTEDLLVTVKLRKMKACRSSNMVVTLEGSPFEKADVNVVYWLERHLNNLFGISLVHFDSWKMAENLQQHLWAGGTDAMTLAFQKRAFQAGFPLKHFGFHSLRSGFISSALINAGDDDQARARVLEQCAIIAKWVPFSATEMGYVKSSTVGVHVSTRLVLPNRNHKSVIEQVLSSTEIFHQIKLMPIAWTGRELYNSFIDFSVRMLCMSCIAKGEPVGTEHNLFNKALYRFGRSHNPNGTRNQVMSTGREVIVSQLREGTHEQELARSLLAHVKHSLVCPTELVTSNEELPSLLPKPTRGRRVRVRVRVRATYS
ncbi:hypothetical protein BLNAU_20484 [Blattamonas nauphoetae]|uniref:Tyr recombinase domain-containing protein n=1 Tax=Blattamonas nauphoetae TaxID=2049346 RepID=A0ABQ9WYS5_9EUKA|nr:hypothetical protein BLNAU_20484 [Blattamonas nauphoetae]